MSSLTHWWLQTPASGLPLALPPLLNMTKKYEGVKIRRLPAGESGRKWSGSHQAQKDYTAKVDLRKAEQKILTGRKNGSSKK